MKYFVILILFIFKCLELFAQNCFDAGFESGTSNGYLNYIGRIDRAGNVIIDIPGTAPGRHEIMHISDGFDPIAFSQCDSNKMLPVVPSGGGQYAIRLGNENVGAQAERILLNFTVTQDVSFFLLRYAVILNDPNHKYFEQPRFELRIKDSNGKTFPCGEYLVRADSSISGFENCHGNWKVRPWTAAGFELKSFIGQTISIEILTTDCSLGGHAGYAYLDATCKPLELKLEGYCPGSNSAKMSVTEGFETYLWNTGATSSSIDIQNPIPGTIYTVEVTSATKCTLKLSDTIPSLEIQKNPKFDLLKDTIICPGTQLWVHPAGTDLNEVFWLEGGYSADSFLIKPKQTTTFHFIARDKYGCQSDTLNYTVVLPNLNLKLMGNTNICPGDSTLLFVDAPDSLVNYRWSPGNLLGTEIVIAPSITTLYTVVADYGSGCDLEKTIIVNVKLSPPIKFATSTDSVFCEGVPVHLSVSGEGISQVNWPSVEKTGEHIVVNPKENTKYPIQIINLTGCDTQYTEISIYIHKTPQVELGPDLCSSDKVFLHQSYSEGWQYKWNDFTTDSVLEVTKTGTYWLEISSECGIASDSIFVLIDFEDCSAFVPNIFSPNSSLLTNRRLTPVFNCDTELLVDYIFEVYNRWGSLVHRSTNPFDEGWDGHNEISGVYVWRLYFFNRVCDTSKQFTGDVLVCH